MGVNVERLRTAVQDSVGRGRKGRLLFALALKLANHYQRQPEAELFPAAALELAADAATRGGYRHGKTPPTTTARLALANSKVALFFPHALKLAGLSEQQIQSSKAALYPTVAGSWSA